MFGDFSEAEFNVILLECSPNPTPKPTPTPYPNPHANPDSNRLACPYIILVVILLVILYLILTLIPIRSITRTESNLNRICSLNGAHSWNPDLNRKIQEH